MGATTLQELTAPGAAATKKPGFLGAIRRLFDSMTATPGRWLFVTAILLGVSGGVRFWRDRQFDTVAKEGSISPFPLKELPRVLGSWHMVEGSEVPLDPEVARIAGSSDHLLRVYMDERT